MNFFKLNENKIATIVNLINSIKCEI